MRLSMKFKEKSEQGDLLISLGQHRALEDVGKRLEEGELLFASFDDILFLDATINTVKNAKSRHPQQIWI